MSAMVTYALDVCEYNFKGCFGIVGVADPAFENASTYAAPSPLLPKMVVSFGTCVY
jgi:hypothetical protein